METKPGKIFALIPLIMADVGAVGKTRKNEQQGYKFRGIDEVYNAIQGPLAKHGVFFVPKVIRRDREERKTAKGSLLMYTILDVEFTFFASDGSSITATTTGEAMDSGDKSCNKAMSAALKYALFDVFCIPTEEQKDTEEETHEPLPKTPPHIEQFLDQLDAAVGDRELANAAKACSAAISAAKAKYKVDDYTKLTQTQCGEIIAAVKEGKFDKFGQEGKAA